MAIVGALANRGSRAAILRIRPYPYFATFLEMHLEVTDRLRGKLVARTPPHRSDGHVVFDYYPEHGGWGAVKMDDTKLIAVANRTAGRPSSKGLWVGEAKLTMKRDLPRRLTRMEVRQRETSKNS